MAAKRKKRPSGRVKYSKDRHEQWSFSVRRSSDIIGTGRGYNTLRGAKKGIVSLRAALVNPTEEVIE